jgi:hypothetical protein
MADERSVLFVAAGGGGDALAALMVARDLLGIHDVRRLPVASFAWERKVFDPVPGPRLPGDFVGLKRAGVHNWEVPPTARLREGVTFLPSIARASGARVFLLDPAGGVRGIAVQLRELMQLSGSSTVVIVDVGGDILARGDEPGLRSPLADALVLAGAAELEDVCVVALGLGLDGELGEHELRQACSTAARYRARGTGAKRLSRAVATDYMRYWLWHPSEATGLTCLSALGYQGSVEVRSDGLIVRMTARSAHMHSLCHDWVLARNTIARTIRNTESLDSAEAIVRATQGHTEIDIERQTVEQLRSRVRERSGAESDLRLLERRLLAYSDAAWERGIAYLTLRRIAEVLGLRADVLAALRDHLGRTHQRACTPPVWVCDPEARTSRRRQSMV